MYDYIRKNQHIEKELTELTKEFVILSQLKNGEQNAVVLNRTEISFEILRRNSKQLACESFGQNSQLNKSQGY